MAALYPLLFKPIFKDYLWGGRNLGRLGRDIPDSGPVAESWEISAHEDGMTVVKNGPYAGKTLEELLDFHGASLVGKRNEWALKRGKFPLLVKLLDANKRLSVQVHPEDAYALENENNELGKTEMWVVLEAAPDAAIVLGLAEKITPENLRRAVDEGQLEPLLNRIPIQAGDHICVPSGTLHAIMAGAVIVEIQQNSNTTYRVFDWNRVDSEGNSRELHTEKALDVLNFNQIKLALPEPEPVERRALWQSERLCQNKYFTTERVFMQPGSRYSGNCDGSTLEIWGLLSGKAEVAGTPISGVDFVLLPASLGPFLISASEETVFLRTYTG